MIYIIYLIESYFILQTCTESNVEKPCPLNCNLGKCQNIEGQGPKCICPSLYTGRNCERYICLQHCKNRGICFVHTENGISQPFCNCPPEWTGDRCETPVSTCHEKCHNGGTCLIIDGKEKCLCPQNVFGRLCENTNCELICGKHGKCIQDNQGFKCKCEEGYSGPKCDWNACHQHCQNGGVCQLGAKQPECVCPPLFTGRRCEIQLCAGLNPPPECNSTCNCLHGGTCDIRAGLPICRCTETWIGNKCEVSN